MFGGDIGYADGLFLLMHRHTGIGGGLPLGRKGALSMLIVALPIKLLEQLPAPADGASLYAEGFTVGRAFCNITLLWPMRYKGSAARLTRFAKVQHLPGQILCIRKRAGYKPCPLAAGVKGGRF